MPFVRPLSKLAVTAQSAAEIPELVEEAFAAARAPHGGPAFVDLPLDYVFQEAEDPEERGAGRRVGGCRGFEGGAGRGGRSGRAAVARRAAPGGDGGHRPLLGPRRGGAARAGGDPAGARRSSTASRGGAWRPTTSCVSRARAAARCARRTWRWWSGCRWTFGWASEGRSGSRRRSWRPTWRSPRAGTHGRPRWSCTGRCSETLRDLRAAAGPRGGVAARERLGGASCARRRRSCARASGRSSRTSAPRCTRCGCTASCAGLLERDAIVIGDGGDFVSYAGRVVDSFEPGCWLDPGPLRVPGRGAGVRARGEARAPGAPGGAAAGATARWASRGWSGHAGTPRRGRGGGGRQQRRVGPGEAPDGVPSTGTRWRPTCARVPATTRWPRRWAARASWWSAPSSCGARWSGRWRRGVPALVNVLTDPAVAYPRRSNLA